MSVTVTITAVADVVIIAWLASLGSLRSSPLSDGGAHCYWSPQPPTLYPSSILPYPIHQAPYLLDSGGWALDAQDVPQLRFPRNLNEDNKDHGQGCLEPGCSSHFLLVWLIHTGLLLGCIFGLRQLIFQSGWISQKDNWQLSFLTQQSSWVKWSSREQLYVLV